MHRRGDQRRKRRFHERAAVKADLEFRTDDRLRCRGAETDDCLRSDDRDLGFEPRTACRNLHRVRLLVDAALPTWFPLEVLDDVADVDLCAVDAGLVESAIEKLPRGTDKGSSLEVFAISRLFADEHHR